MKRNLKNSLMQKHLAIPAIIVALLSAPAMSETVTYHFKTSKHQIRVQCFGKYSSVFSDNCSYEAWNHPKKEGQGAPDIEVNNGSANTENYLPVKGVRCLSLQFSFDVDKHTAIHINRDYSSSATCYDRKPGTNGSLTVLIDGKPKSHYRLYETKEPTRQ
jgi:hypothetical protein